MRNFYKILLLGILTTSSLSSFANPSKNSNLKDLHKKTAYGFIVSYVMRYDPDKWSCKNKDGGQEFFYQDGKLEVTLNANKEEKNLSREALDNNFQNALQNGCSDTAFYASYEIKPSEFVLINGINFLHQSATLNLTPNSKHFKRSGQSGYWRYISEKGASDQIDYYTFSGDKGRVSFCIESEGKTISSLEQIALNDLFQGFSFDGTACKGPAKLRALKSAWEILTEK